MIDYGMTSDDSIKFIKEPELNNTMSMVEKDIEYSFFEEMSKDHMMTQANCTSRKTPTPTPNLF
jgi:hypothetical protein